MYILKNAIKNILRNKIRNLLIGVIIFIISFACTISLSINNSSTKLIESYDDKYDITANISMNRENMMKNFDPSDSSSKEDMKKQFNTIDDLTIDEINNYGDSKYVKSYYYTNNINMNSSNLEKATSETSSDSNNNNSIERKQPKITESGDFKVIGYSSLESMTDFIEGKYTVKEGIIPTTFNEDNCIINSELATLNNIKVGDTIKLVSPNDTNITYNLKVTGIYEENINEEANFEMFSSSSNTIITNTIVISKITEKDEKLREQINPTFILINKESIPKFTNEVKDKGLNEYLTVNSNLDDIESSTTTIKNVKSFAITFLIITIIIGGLILLIINMINIRERKYEIGVLRTIGMKKSTLSLQFLSELLIVAIIFLTLGSIVGSLSSVPVSNKLLENEINSSKNELETIDKNFGGLDGNKGIPKKMNGIVNVTEIKSVNAVVDIKVIIELLIIGLLLTLIGSTSAIISIQRFSPLTILKERS